MNKIHLNQLIKTSTVIVLLLQLFICIQNATAQFNDKTFELQEAADQYDERGFMKGKSLSMDGNLVLNNSNGNVNYTYPISSFNLHGYPMDVSLNYCGSVAFTSFQLFQAYGVEGNCDNQGWSKTSQNRPLWIIGLNGFAVQTISQNTEPICPPKDIVSYYSTINNGPYEPPVWLVDGYDFCNRMKNFNFHGAGSGTNAQNDVDVIKLLRADGSVLELCNHADTAFGQHNYPFFYSGMYFEKGTNTKGFAYVELVETRQQSLIDKIVEQNSVDFATEAKQMPRLVHYYPGDGLEYIFREDVAPYGEQFYAGDETVGDWYGRINAQHTIFYLDKIRSEKRDLIEFNYDDKNIGLTGDYSQVLKGRKRVTDFYGHKFTFSEMLARIESFGKNIDIVFDTVLRKPTPDFNISSMLTSGTWLPTSLPMIKKIIDPAGRQISFDYSIRRRNYSGFGWPYKYYLGGTTCGPDQSSYTPTILTKTKRMSRYNEPMSYTLISYFRGDTTINYQLPSEKDAYQLSDVAKKMIKMDYEDEPILTKEFKYFAADTTTAIDMSVSGGWVSIFTTTDNRTNQKTYSTSKYKRNNFETPGIYEFIPGLTFTDLTETTEGSDSIRTKTQTTYDWLHKSIGDTVNINIRKPVSRTITEYTPTDTIRHAYSTFEYEVDTMVHYKMSLAKKHYGFGVVRQYENVWRPDSITSLLYRKITNYQVFPDSLQSFYVVHNWDKYQSLQNYYELKRTDPSFTKSWEDCLEDSDPRVIVSFDDITNKDTVYSYYPAAYIEKSTFITDGDSASYPSTKGKILQGSSKKFASLDKHNTSDIIDRMLVIEDTVYGLGGKNYIQSHSIYEDSRVQLPSSMKNTNGALSDFRYDYQEIPTSWQCSFNSNSLPIGKIKYNDDTDSIGVLHGGEHVLWWHEPLATAQRIRRYLPGHSGIDTMILPSLFERTYYGLHSGVIDPNGWLTSARYDGLGRLLKISYPYDYNSKSNLIEYEHTMRPIRESGFTIIERTQQQRRKTDTVNCTGGWEYRTETKTSEDYTNLHAEALYTIYGGGGDSQQKGGAIPLTTYCEWTAVGDPNIWDTLYYGVIPFRLSNSNIVSLDSAVLEISPTLIDPCFSLFLQGRRVLSYFPPFADSQVVYKYANFNCDSAFTDTSSEILSDTGVVSRAGMKIRIKLSSGLTSAIASGNVDLNVFLEPSVGYLAGYFHNTGDDVMPQIKLYGVFKDDIDLSDFTLKFTHGDYYGKGRTYAYAKVDDTLHTFSKMASDWSASDNRRVSLSSSLISADNSVTENTMYRGNPTYNVKETVSFVNDGYGKPIKSIDQIGYISRINYDHFGRVTQVDNPDSVIVYGDTSATKVTTIYDIGTSLKFGISPLDQDFYGFCSMKSVRNENGIKFTQYSDALGRMRREVTDSGGLHLITRYDYDILNRLTKVKNPQGQITNYWYDDFGRVKYKKQPDLGILSYTYDAVGNTRFTQTNEQDSLGKLTFHQYDDMNRITVVGEARLGSITHDTLPNLHRWSDVLDPNKLHDTGNSAILTANKTLWDTTLLSVPYVVANATASLCMPSQTYSDENYVYSGLTFKQNLTTPGADTLLMSDSTNFENVATKPFNVRIAIHYDTLPQRAGAVWGHYTPASLTNVWNSLSPTGAVRNMKGHEVAVAYRDRANEPFHYVTMSYDERGRVEALMRFTDNIGFDAVYYTYNSANQIIRIMTADGLRKHTTWYGYDWNGRIDSVWTKLDSSGTGLGFTSPAYPSPSARPHDTSVSIVYRYDKRGLVDSTVLVKPQVVETYKYNGRKWLDSMEVKHLGTTIFTQGMQFEPTGNIIHQYTRQLGEDLMSFGYTYDNLSRLISWGSSSNHTPHGYIYDSVGNRREERIFRTSVTDTTAYVYGNGNNQLTQMKARDTLTFELILETNYKYTGDGALRIRQERYDEQHYDYTQIKRDVFKYSYNGLLKKFGHSLWGGASIECRMDSTLAPQWQWEYRYSAGGERESKRNTVTPLDGLGNNRSHLWTYYLLGGNKQQLAVYNGRETDVPNVCLDSGHRVHFYPTEYLTYGNGGSALITTRPDFEQEFKIVDHLGSTRVVLDDTGGVISQYDYEPFGKPIALAGLNSRKNYIDKEKDQESELGNYGVRQQDDALGRFTSPDALWEQYRSWSLYQYSRNNPLRLIDPSGFGDGDKVAAEASMAAGTWTTISAIGGIVLGVGLILSPTFGAGQVTGCIVLSTSIAALGLGMGTVAASTEAVAKGKTEVGYIPQGVGEAIGFGTDKANGGDGKVGAAVGSLIETTATTMLGGFSGGRFSAEALGKSLIGDNSPFTGATAGGALLDFIDLAQASKKANESKKATKEKNQIASGGGGGTRVDTPQHLDENEVP